MELTDIFNKKSDKYQARLNLARWYDKIDNLDIGQFKLLRILSVIITILSLISLSIAQRMPGLNLSFPR